MMRMNDGSTIVENRAWIDTQCDGEHEERCQGQDFPTREVGPDR